MRSGRAGCAVSILVGALLTATSARAQVPGEEIARRSFEEGVALEKKGDYAAALSKFKQSEEIKATLGNRYHKAYCLEMTGKLAAASTEYEAVEKAARDANKRELAEAARARIEPLREKVPKLALTVAAPAPKDTEATLDGVVLAPSLLDGKAFRIDPGEHVLAVRASGREPFDKRFSAGEGSTSSIEIVLEQSAPARLDRTSPTAPRVEAAPRARVLPLATTAGAVVLAGAGVAAFVVAGGKQDDLENACKTKASCDGDKGPTRTFDALALGSWIGAAGLAALSVVLWTSSPAEPAQARLTVRPSWAGLEGRF